MTTHYNAHGQVDHSDTSEGGYYVRVEDRRNYGCLIVIIGLLIVLALGMFITSKVGAESARIPQAGECNSRVNHSESMIYVVGYYSCESIPQTGLKADYMVPEETYIPVDTESRKTGKGESAVESTNVESSVADDNPPADDKKDESDNGRDTPKSDDSDHDKKGNNGHGNNADGVDSSNPGHGPRNEDGADDSDPVDDENRS